MIRALFIIFFLGGLNIISISNILAEENNEFTRNIERYEKIGRQVDDHVSVLNKKNQQWNSRLKQEIAEVENNQQDLEKRLHEKKLNLEAINKQIANLSQQKQILTNDYETTVDDMKLVQGAYQASLRNLSQQWQQSPTQLIEPQRKSALVDAQAYLGFPNIIRLNELITYAVDDMKMTATVSKARSSVSFDNGDVNEENLRIIGGLMAFSDTDTPQYIMFTDKLPTVISPDNSTISHNLTNWLNNRSPLLPLDLSQGRMLPSLTNEQTVIDWVKQGGEVLWPILVLALFGLIIALWRAFILFKWQPLKQLTNEDNPTTTDLNEIKLHLLNNYKIPAASVLANSMVMGSSIESMDLRLKQLMLKQMTKFEQGLGFIALLAAMAPMLGLLGTVSGMIETFQSLTEFGNSDPKLLSQGISKALITTQAGLLVALPLLLLHYPLKRRAQALSLNMEQQSTLLLALYIDAGAKPHNG